MSISLSSTYLSMMSRCQKLNRVILWNSNHKYCNHHQHNQININNNDYYHFRKNFNLPVLPPLRSQLQSSTVLPTRISSLPLNNRIVISSSPTANINSSDNKQQINNKNEQPEDPTKATEEQLALLSERLANHLPKFFKVPHDFGVYNRNIIFEDNIRNVKAVGINAYAWQITKIKVGAHFKYGKVTFNILKMTRHLEDSSIKIRWRIKTYPGNQIVWAFWKFKLWNVKDSLEEHKDDWIDGFSILYVGGDGLIHKHVCDKLMPDTNENKNRKESVQQLAEKLGVMSFI